MYRVKLIKGLSYTGAVSATKENPFVDIEDKAIADAVVASGYFKLVEAESETNEPADLSKMTVAQLEAYAKENNIDLAGASKKADIIKAIEAANTESETNCEADYSEDGE